MIKLIKEFLNNFQDLSQYYDFLINKTKNHENIGLTNEKIIDEFFVIVKHKNKILSYKNKLKKIIKSKNYFFIKNLITKNNYNINFEYLINELNKYQEETKRNFSYEQLSIIPFLLSIIYIEKLNILCREEYIKLVDIEDVSNIISSKEELSIKDFIPNNFDLKNNLHYIFEINNQLKNIKKNNHKIFKDLNNYLTEKEVNLKDLISEEYQKKITANLLVTNILNNLKEFLNYQVEDIYNKVSNIEKILLKDSVYKNMTLETKKLYRKELHAKAKSNHISVIKYLEENFDKTEHIGYKILKKENNTLKVITYTLFLLIISAFITYYISTYFIKPKILSFILLYLPILEFLKILTNYILLQITPTKIIPKLDYTKAIPKDAATMVVITTIISTKEKIEEVFNNLESYYLLNKSDNLYFSLLGDATKSKLKVENFDKELKEFGQNYAEKLNKKYKKDIFYFLYRRRVWNSKEKAYLGYGKKKGALLQFNKILLKEYVDETKYFNVNMLNNHNLDIDYVIKLDPNTKLSFNTIPYLIGTIKHPLNAPILNKNKTKVISGYGLIEPRINIDLSSSKQSLFSKYLIGSTRKTCIPNFSQNLFSESEYLSQGIYDLKLSNQLLENSFSDSIEGSYLRCGYVTDVEIFTSSKSNFIKYSSEEYQTATEVTENIKYLLNKISKKDGNKVKNPLNLLSKLKILDNLLNIFISPLLIIIVLLTTLLKDKLSILWILVIFLGILIYNYILLKLKQNEYKTSDEKNTSTFSIKCLIFKTYLFIATSPFYIKLYLDAFFRTIYRMFYPHKNFIDWNNSIDENNENLLNTYVKKFTINYLFSIIFIVVALVTKIYLLFFISIIYLTAPIILYLLNKEPKQIELEPKEKEELEDLAKRTWKYFEDHLTEENNYLISDNYQENREEKTINKTTPANIGFSLTSVISAYELKFISFEKCLDLITKILNTVNTLPKWNGHLYQEYNQSTKEILNFKVSSVNSGIFTTCIIITKEFLINHNQEGLVKKCDKLINNINFKKLLTKKEKFSQGFDVLEDTLLNESYDLFASEALLTSYVAISLGNISAKHWFNLDRTLTKYNNKKGLISKNGTATEYFLSHLFFKNYENSLLSETLDFTHFCQKEYINKISTNLPWGISKSAYYEINNQSSYKTNTFKIPLLKAKNIKENRIVLSPYSSIMTLDLYPKDVYNNLEKFKKLEMYSDYGFYEAYDYDYQNIIKAYFTNHQGISLIGITNYLKTGFFQNLFHQNINIKSQEILLKEKEPSLINVDMKLLDYQKYDYQKEKLANDIRVIDCLSNTNKEISCLSNKNYSIIIDEDGKSLSKYRQIKLNRASENLENSHGIFLYIKDLTTNYLWSNTYAPLYIKPDKYEVTFKTDKIEFLRKDSNIITKTEIIVCKDNNTEIRKITLKNISNVDKELELTSYTEPVLLEDFCESDNRILNKMFIKTEYDSKEQCLIAKRTNLEENSINNYMFTKLFIEKNTADFSYETERSNFIGRNNNLSNPYKLEEELTNYTGNNIDPILSLRNKVIVQANDSISVYLIVGFSRSSEQIYENINNFSTIDKINKAYEISKLMHIIDTKNMQLTSDTLNTFNKLLNLIYQSNNIELTEERLELLRRNVLGQSGLWKFGLSGDRPIILVELNDIRDMSFIYEILKAYEYYKTKFIFIDILIINNESSKFTPIIKKEIDEELYRINTLNHFYNTLGTVVLINNDNITREDYDLLNIVPTVKFNIKNHESLKTLVEDLRKNCQFLPKTNFENEKNILIEKTEKLDFDNSYGGFKNNGKEYFVYNQNTKEPWSNILANENFGSIITNNGCGYTYAYNSREFKITDSTEETILNEKSEGFRFNGYNFDPTVCTHGFGYSVLSSETLDIKHDITEFVATKDPAKIYILDLKNKLDKKVSIKIDFWIKPILGNSKEKTLRYILSDFNKEENYLEMRNVYSNNYNDINVFMTSSEKIAESLINNLNLKSITLNIELKADEEKTISFTLGSSYNDKENYDLVKKYSDLNNCLSELKKVKRFWKDTLEKIQIETIDKSFDYVINGWYLYQTISSRIFAKASFSKTIGILNYKELLEDAMNLVTINEEFTRNQILENSKHQFVEGEVLHWWNEKNHYGLRSRFKDDYLWLIYTVIHYIKITNDYSILNEKTPYVIGENLSDYETEKGIIFNYSENKDTILNHCLKSLELAITSLGSNKLPLFGSGDSNELMTKVGVKGKGESAFLGFFIYNIINEFSNIIKKANKNIDCSSFLEFNTKLKENLNKKAWDGDYFIRAIFDNGDKLGSTESSECKIDLLSQSFAIISEVANKEQIKSILTSVEDELVDNNIKVIKDFTMPFKKSLNIPGKIMNYPEKFSNNGGQTTKYTSFYLLALIKVGYYDRAYQYFQMINPINRSDKKEKIDKYQIEPYVLSENISAAEAFLGQGSFSWLTGAASWFYRIGIEEILGFHKNGNILKLEPKIPIAWDNFKLTYKYLNTTYKIEVIKSEKEALEIDGKNQISNKIELTNDKKVHKIKLFIKK